MRKSLTVLAVCAAFSAQAQTFKFGSNVNPQGVAVEIDSKGMRIGGEPVIPVMGEMHYARVPESEWRREVQKMKAGGVSILSTYVFWIHHEEQEGMWNWQGNRNLHEFLSVCKEEGMPVVLRIGPFCHGEVYQGGLPEWLVEKSIADGKDFRLRSTAKGFLAAVQRLYSNIYAQASDMLWKDGGPVIGVQIENECRGPWPYYQALKDMAVSIGFDVPFYTRTGWPKLNGRETFGEMLPLYGDYADGFWDRLLTDMPGDYPKAFVFKDSRISSVIATETFGTQQDTKMAENELSYPYFTCELGGGMAVAYHRRINISGNEALPLAVCKVGSGSNLPGYYMYHGGTNPYNPRHTMAECQASKATANNDLPHLSYEFQSPLGEMGQVCANAFHQTRFFHQFLADWGGELSQMNVDTLSEHYARRGTFEFRNDYVRLLNEQGAASVTPDKMRWNGLEISSACLQPFAKTADTIYFVPIRNSKAKRMTIDGKAYTLKWDKPLVVKGKRIVALSQQTADKAFVIDGVLHYAKRGGILFKDNGRIAEEYWEKCDNVAVGAELLKQEGDLRKVNMGKAKVAEQPSDSDFCAARSYLLSVNKPDTMADSGSYYVEIAYKGDCARVYADGKLVQDNFWNGKPMLVRLSSIAGKKAELKILPLGKDAPIYLQKEQKEQLQAAGKYLLSLDGISVWQRKTE